MDEIRNQMHNSNDEQVIIYADAYDALQQDAVSELSLELTVGDKKFNLGIFPVEVLAAFVDFLDEAQAYYFSEVEATDQD